LSEPEELATDAIAELEGALEELNQIIALLENSAPDYIEGDPSEGK
jgi:hypothetical protein